MKKNTLFKIIAISAIVLSILSWIIPASSASGAELSDLGLNRVSLYNLVEYPYLAFQYFATHFLFILAVGGLYGVLAETGKYRNKLEKIAKSMKGKETVFLLVTAFVLAALSSVCGLNILLFVFVPALCGIILLMGYDKITAFITTIVSILIGTIGSTYGYYVTGYVNAILTSDFTTELVAKIGLFVLTFAVYALFLIKHTKNSKTSELTAEDEEKLFLGEKKLSKKPSWPLYLVFGVFFVLLVLGYTNWTESFSVEAFSNFHTTITEWTIGEHTVVSYLIEGLDSFGGWAYEQYTILILISSMLLALIYNIKVSNALSAFGKGVKSLIKVAGLVVFAYILVIITAYHPFFITVTDWMIGFVADMSGVFAKILYIIMVTLNTILSSVLNVEMLYVVQSGLPYISAVFADYTNSLAIITQSVYGLTMLVAPTSVMMIIGLTYLDIPYLEWLKKSWKLILELLAIVLIVICVVVFL